MRLQLFILILFVTNGHLHAQTSKPTLIIRIKKVETELLIDTVNRGFSKGYLEAIKVKVAYFDVIKQKGKVKYRPTNFIVIPILTGDHECSFDFLEGAIYSLPVAIEKLPNASFKKFKKWHYRLNCEVLPSLILK